MLKRRFEPVKIQKARVQDPFWDRYTGRVPERIIPYQWDMMNDRVSGMEESGCIHNFRAAAGEEDGGFKGMPFQDSDLAKWIEAAAFSLATKPDQQLEGIIDEMADLLEKVQDEEGYLDTRFILMEPEKRWTNLLEGHELYVSGHLIEAAVAYYLVTGKEKLLSIVKKNADLICRTFGKEEGKRPGYPGHEEIELALVKLYEVTGEERYLDQAYYFITERGQDPHLLEKLHNEYGEYIFPEFSGFDLSYNQCQAPVYNQETVEGHAVRAVYMLTAMADLAWYKDDARLLESCEKLYRNIVKKRMYITGGIGSAGKGERFTTDYDLPNESAYAESCASIGLAMFCRRMLQITGRAGYADTMETALYNTVAAGISLSGDRFFYVNPLEVWPDACRKNTDLDHVKEERQGWFACACCPPNIARTLASLHQYAWFSDGYRLIVALYAGGECELNLSGRPAVLEVKTDYPFSGKVHIKLKDLQQDTDAAILLRKPGWTKRMQISVNGSLFCKNENAYKPEFLEVQRTWRHGDVIDIEIEMEPCFMQANPRVRADCGKVALMKGPVVYCLEEADNGYDLSAISIDTEKGIFEKYREDILGGMYTLECEGYRLSDDGWDDELYRTFMEKTEPVSVTAIPYCFWNNRGCGEMSVWIRSDSVKTPN